RAGESRDLVVVAAARARVDLVDLRVAELDELLLELTHAAPADRERLAHGRCALVARREPTLRRQNDRDGEAEDGDRDHHLEEREAAASSAASLGQALHG